MVSNPRPIDNTPKNTHQKLGKSSVENHFSEQQPHTSADFFIVTEPSKQATKVLSRLPSRSASLSAAAANGGNLRARAQIDCACALLADTTMKAPQKGVGWALS